MLPRQPYDGGISTLYNGLSTVRYCNDVAQKRGHKTYIDTPKIQNNTSPRGKKISDPSSMDESESDLPMSQTNQQTNSNNNSPIIKTNKRKYREKTPQKNKAYQIVKDFSLKLWLSVKFFITKNLILKLFY